MCDIFTVTFTSVTVLLFVIFILEFAPVTESLSGIAIGVSVALSVSQVTFSVVKLKIVEKALSPGQSFRPLTRQ